MTVSQKINLENDWPLWWLIHCSDLARLTLKWSFNLLKRLKHVSSSSRMFIKLFNDRHVICLSDYAMYGHWLFFFFHRQWAFSFSFSSDSIKTSKSSITFSSTWIVQTHEWILTVQGKTDCPLKLEYCTCISIQSSSPKILQPLYFTQILSHK